MAIIPQSGRLTKELKLLDVSAIALGTTLSAGLFLLPGQEEQAGAQRRSQSDRADIQELQLLRQAPRLGNDGHVQQRPSVRPEVGVKVLSWQLRGKPAAIPL